MSKPKWRGRERMEARRFVYNVDRDAFLVGYNDGYAGRERDAADLPISSYSAGYWEGFNDGNGATRPIGTPIKRVTVGEIFTNPKGWLK